jgi:hypothetical protein
VAITNDTYSWSAAYSNCSAIADTEDFNGRLLTQINNKLWHSVSTFYQPQLALQNKWIGKKSGVLYSQNLLY